MPERRCTLKMKIEIPEDLAAFVVAHFEKRKARQIKMMPDPDYVDPWLGYAEKADRDRHKEEMKKAKHKALNFIHNATLVIELLQTK